MSKRVDLYIHPDGKVEVKPTGFMGPECERVTAEIEEALGTVVERERTPEYYMKTQTTQQQRLSTS